MAVRAIRGATQVAADDRDEVLSATRELVATVLERNELSSEDLISILFTATPDLVSEFPALAARELGMGDVPLMCATEIAVPHALPRVLRLMAHVDTDRARAEMDRTGVNARWQAEMAGFFESLDGAAPDAALPVGRLPARSDRHLDGDEGDEGERHPLGYEAEAACALNPHSVCCLADIREHGAAYPRAGPTPTVAKMGRS